MASKNYTWQVSSPNIDNGVGVISSAYNVDGKSPFTTISKDNPTGYVKVFPNSTSTDLNIKNLEYAIQTDGKITYRVLDATNNPRQYNSLQELADGRGNWNATTTNTVKIQMNGILSSSAQSKNITPTSPTPSQYSQAGIGQTTSIGLKTKITSSEIVNILGKEIVYPTQLRTNGQDFIKFTLIEYGQRGFQLPAGPNTKSFNIGKRDLKSAGTSVYLPIQPSINDQNDIGWGEDNMNVFKAVLANMATQGSGTVIASELEKVGEIFGSNNEYEKVIRRYLGGQAVGINPLSRTDGLVLNPNLELLFSGPSLRPFNFTFRLSPRDPSEADQVKKIIKFFKIGSTVRTTNDGLFLKAPYVFDIAYKYKGQDGNADHPGLNKIKTCALRTVSVNYTPDGSYMTFEDGTMTSYEISLQFSELEPVYDSDYVKDDTLNKHPIGF